MRRAGAVGVAVLIGGAALSACGSDDSNPSGAGASGGSVGSAGSAGRGGNAGSASDAAAGTGGSAGGCERFGFLATGAACPSSGCPSFGCSCPEGFPKSITSCTADGCLVSGDCSAICAGDLGDALDCTDTHGIGAGGSGASGTAGTGGSGGGYVPPPCTASDVQRSPAAAFMLGNATGVQAAALLTDESGATYVAGTLPAAQPVDFGGGELAARRQMFLLKLDAQRRHLWSKRFGSEFGIELVKSFNFDANGDLLIGGVTGFDTDLGGGPKPHSAGPQFFVTRYKRDGGFVAGHVVLVSNTIPELASVLETPGGDYLLVGSFTGAAPFGATTLTSAGEADIFVLRLSATGSVLDLRQYGRARNDLIFDAVAAPDGTSYLIGFSYYAVNFGKDPIDLGSDALSYVVALDASLQPVWQKLIGSGGAYPRRVQLDGASLVVAGDAYGEIFYGDKQGGALPRAHTFVLRIDRATGALQRGDTYDTTGSTAQVTALGRFTDGLAVGGYIHPPADFGGGALTSSQSLVPFVARFDAGGKHLWSTFFCEKSTRGVAAIAAAGTTPIVALEFQENLELGAFRFTGRGTALLDLAP